MYEPFFGMERRPFSATPDPGCFFRSSELQAVLDELTVCVERGQGIGILTAAAGIGKTLLCQRLAANLRRSDRSGSCFECVYLGNSNFPTRRSLLQAILFEMGDEYSRRDEPELRLDLRSRLRSLRPQREALVLIVDEAHLFSDELLEELRTLSDIADNGSTLVRIVLSGQHELEERLTDRVFDALNQRISAHVFAEPLTISESIEYISHRLEWAGCDIETIFTEEAVGVIARASGGVPRCLNQLSDHSLLLAFASDQKPVSEDTVREALDDLKQLPLHWNDVSDGTAIVGFVDDDSADEASEPTSELAESSSNDSPNYDFAAQADALSGIVESLRGPAASRPELTTPTAISPLDGGIELDFSSDHDDVEADVVISVDEGEEITAQVKIPETSTPETAVFEFAGDESAVSEQTEESIVNGDGPVDHDETLIQVLRPAVQETLFESANGHNTQDEDEDTDDSGISFQITSRGFELDDFGPPEELSEESVGNSCEDNATTRTDASGKENDAMDSGVIEFAFDEESSTETVDENAEFSEEPDAGSGRTVSAAEITLGLLGQDSVLPELRRDSIVEDTVPETGGSNSDVAASDDTTETVSDERESGLFNAPDSDIAVDNSADGLPIDEVDVSSGELENETSEDEEPVMANATCLAETDYEEELVFDPYAALQEPESAGIVWNVTSFSKRSDFVVKTEEASGPIDECSTLESNIGEEQPGDHEPAEPAAEEIGEPVEVISEPEQHHFEAIISDEPAAHEVAADDIADSGLVPEEEGNECERTEVAPSFSSAEAEEGEIAVEESSDEALESSDPTMTDHPLAAEADIVAEEVEQVVEADFAVHEEDEVAAESAESAIDEPEFSQDSQTAMQSEHDIVQPEDTHPLRASRLIDSIFPLLDELDEDLDSVEIPGLAGRSVLDIEAELIQAIEHDNDDLEDRIGATMLDICLDTQSALQESAAAIRSAEVVDEEDEDLDDTQDEMPATPFDIVQPEPESREEGSSYQLDPHFSEPSVEAPRTDSSSAAQAKPAAKPFGRLFSDLRRRRS